MSIAPGDFGLICDIVRNDAAIVLEAGKEYLVETRLAPLAIKEGFATLDKLCEKIRAFPHDGLRRKIVESLTTHETSFFRDIEPFDALRRTVLPELIRQRSVSKQLSIWCAAASTGQEPYSLALMIKENFPEIAGWNVKILATDISQEILRKAALGRFSQIEVNRGLPVQYLIKYFKKNGAEWEIREDIRKAVQFQELNLIKPLSGVPACDLIFIRNVLIYFDLETKKVIFNRIRSLLRNDGYLFLGAAETTLNIDSNYERVSIGKFSCYRLKR